MINERIYDTFVTQLGFNLPTSKKLGLPMLLRFLTAGSLHRILRQNSQAIK